MTVGEMLDALEAARISIKADGDAVLVGFGSPDDLAPFRDALRRGKPEVLAALALRDEIMKAATVETHRFDREVFNALWTRWLELQAVDIPLDRPVIVTMVKPTQEYQDAATTF